MHSELYLLSIDNEYILIPTFIPCAEPTHLFQLGTFSVIVYKVPITEQPKNMCKISSKGMSEGMH